MRFVLIFVLLLTAVSKIFAGKISGNIADAHDHPLPFSSITIKGTLQGTTSNNMGNYSLLLAKGEYIFVVQHIGYKTLEAKVVVDNDSQIANFKLSEQQYDLGNIIIKQGEDPAYAIIRNAIKKRKFYHTELKKFEAQVYIKGQLKTRSYPNKFLGKDVDFEDGDTSKQKMIFLSETVARYSVDEPKRKVEVLSTKVSGDKDAFGFGSPQIFSFYQNNISLGNINPRGFISPIADNALAFYRYKFAGTFFENSQMINRIQVIPKRRYEPLFNGYINIIENEWRIQSVQLVLYKENQMQMIDTLHIDHLYVPFKNLWVIKQQTISPAIKIFGFDMTGNFVQVYDKFNLDPKFTKGFFDNVILSFEDSSNKKSAQYWDSIRPVQLLPEEVTDYKKKDSLEQVRHDPRYLDSLDRRRNKISVVSILLTGQTFSREKSKSTLQVSSMLESINYNTVEGAVLHFAPTYEKRFSDKKRNEISIIPNVRYGFSNKHFNAHISTRYKYGNRYANSLSIAGGRKVYQVNNSNPINPQFNSISTLQYEHNYMKIYEAAFAQIMYAKELGSGVGVTANVQYQNRKPLENTSAAKWRDFADREFTPNLSFAPHNAFIAAINIKWKPGTRYIKFPNQTVNIGSTFPTFHLNYERGIKNVFASNVDYDKWSLAVNDGINLKLLGTINYNLAIGGFLTKNTVFLPDYQHYTGNQLTLVSQFRNTFQLMPYYAYSNMEKFSSTAHVEYHLNGFVTNKIPFFKKLNWFLVTGANSLFLNQGTTYIEAFAGLENIFKTIRIDYVQSFTNDGRGNKGVRISLPFLGGREVRSR